MAKPIRATPTLRGADAVRFVKTMLREEKNPSKARVRTIKNAMAKYGFYSKFLTSG